MPVEPKRINQLYPKVGNDGDRPVLRWDPATTCYPNCPVYDDCPYQKNGRCKLEMTYMNKIFQNLVNPDPNKGIADQLNDIELQRVGIHLIPLYHQLIKMKKEAFAVRDISHVNKQGSIKIHPVFAEIREIIRCISKEMKDLDINGKWEKKHGAGPITIGGSGPSIEELMEKGDPGYYESISKEEK